MQKIVDVVLVSLRTGVLEESRIIKLITAISVTFLVGVFRVDIYAAVLILVFVMLALKPRTAALLIAISFAVRGATVIVLAKFFVSPYYVNYLYVSFMTKSAAILMFVLIFALVFKLFKHRVVASLLLSTAASVYFSAFLYYVYLTQGVLSSPNALSKTWLAVVVVSPLLVRELFASFVLGIVAVVVYILLAKRVEGPVIKHSN
ncbi:hypothetical protein KC614_03505 [candidate division WWE3 bacterium]|uniref:Uncharacterized protein n=1 Tax=candidate division WWE3 bacterium TaxID=2053526 RepID=A0A955LL19_UNCKA|nr:hypothetical protein [candidate division WWE3 bacterium]